jgi:hypothetical protein
MPIFQGLPKSESRGVTLDVTVTREKPVETVFEVVERDFPTV